jgi:hypothetical protein
MICQECRNATLHCSCEDPFPNMDPVEGFAVQNWPSGRALLVRPHGTGTLGMDVDEGWPVMLEWWEGRPRLIVWADINREDPTHTIELEGALETARKEE